MTLTTNLTNEEYRERMRRGMFCWDCKSDEIRDHDPQVSAWMVVVPFSCDKCGARWDEIHEFKGYRNLKL